LSAGQDVEKKKPSKKTRQNEEIRDLEERLIQSLGIKVEIRGDAKKGKIELNYYSTEELSALFKRLNKI
jgi:ParB family chromosome partitioning protein